MFDATIIADSEFLQSYQVSPQGEDLWRTYEDYLKRLARRVGKDSAEFIESENLNQMELLHCYDCILHEIVLGSRMSGEHWSRSKSSHKLMTVGKRYSAFSRCGEPD